MGYEQLMPTIGGVEDRQCNGRTVIRDMLEERKLIGEQQEMIQGVEEF